MRIDWRLLSRAAKELDETLAGVRITGVREVPGGLALTLRARGGSASLHFAVFAQPPMVWLADDLVAAQPSGAVRAIGNAIASMTIAAVRCVPNDRILEFDLQRRSSFGVIDASRLIVELIPRFGNVILCKDGLVVAALREFSLAQNSARAIEIGRPYVGPPPGIRRPEPPIELPPSESVLADFALYAQTREKEQAEGSFTALQTRLRKRLESRAHVVSSERAKITARLLDADRRDALREQGQELFATLHERPENERASAKEQAAELFARYKKLGSAVPGLERRAAYLDTELEAIQVQLWEISRADAAALLEIADELGERDAQALRNRTAPRAPIEVRTLSGSRILVGRSPKQNAELTFRTAKPDDLWFHAQKTPGAHVILCRDDRSDPPVDDILQAATLAAQHSKARHNDAVAVDYTRRKHVRKQKDAPPGLVWYTDFSTILTNPNDAFNS